MLHSEEVKRRLPELGFVRGLQPELGLQKPPGVVDGQAERARAGRKYTVEDVTLLEALNRVVGSDDHAFWWYEERACNGEKTNHLQIR